MASKTTTTGGNSPFSIALTILRCLHLTLRANLPTFRTLLHTLFSLRTILLLLALLNLKSLPFAWHIRLARRFYANVYTLADVRRTLQQYHLRSRASSSSSTTTTNNTHPLFLPTSITSHAPLYETDYNLHKSNSTYFSDLDESRTALATRLLIPGLWSGDKTLENQGIKGRVSVALGSVHCTFHKEIKPYTKYECRSRLLGWDRKWLVIVTFLVQDKGKGKGEVLLASALSKYVVKKGRYTVSPEHCLRVAGWLPRKPEGEKEEEGGVGESGVLVPPSVSETPSGVEETPPVEKAVLGEEAVVKVGEVKERLERVLSMHEGDVENGNVEGVAAEAAKTPTEEGEGGWDWYRIEKERLRGLKLAEAWLAIDTQLKEEYAYSPE